MSTTINAGASATVALPQGQWITITGIGVAVLGPGPQAGTQITLDGDARVGPFQRDQSVYLTATLTALAYDVVDPNAQSSVSGGGVSADAGNALSEGTDGGVYLAEAALGGGGGVGGALVVLSGSRAADAGDNGNTLVYSGSTPITYTINSGLASGWATTIVQSGSGVVTVAAGTATVSSASGGFSTTGANTMLGIAPTGASAYALATPNVVAALAIKDEGSTLVNSPASINFVGSGVTATQSAGDVTVTIPGGGGGGASFAYTGTWASRASAATAGAGAMALITDIPISGGNSIFISDGTNWRPQGGRVTLYRLGAEVTKAVADGLATGVAMAQMSIPAGLLANTGDLVRVWMSQEKAGTTSLTLTYNLKFGALGTSSDPSFGDVSYATTVVSGGSIFEFKRVSSTTVRKNGTGSTTGNDNPSIKSSTSARAAAQTVANLDSVSNTLSVFHTIATAAGAETATLQELVVELFA